MTSRPIGTRRDPFLVSEDKMRELPYVLESFVHEWRETNAADYIQAGGELLHRLKGTTIEADIAALPKTHPHGFANYIPATEEMIEQEIIDRALYEGGPKNVGELHKKLGPDRANAILKAAGIGPGLKPIPRPGSTGPAKEDDSNKPSKNPWHVSWKGTPEQRLAEQTKIIRGSTKAATALARSAGVTLGGQPLKG